MAPTELGLRERRTIEDMLNAKISVDEIERVKEGWSPEQIAGRLQFEGQLLIVTEN